MADFWFLDWCEVCRQYRSIGYLICNWVTIKFITSWKMPWYSSILYIFLKLLKVIINKFLKGVFNVLVITSCWRWPKNAGFPHRHYLSWAVAELIYFANQKTLQVPFFSGLYVKFYKANLFRPKHMGKRPRKVSTRDIRTSKIRVSIIQVGVFPGPLWTPVWHEKWVRR